jgi:hypothetical protein
MIEVILVSIWSILVLMISIVMIGIAIWSEMVSKNKKRKGKRRVK